jgi:hypothetical protein
MPQEGNRMNKHTLARVRLDGAGWAHPYSTGPFSPVLYADGGGDGGGSGSSGGDGDGGSALLGAGAGDQGGQQSGQSGSQSGSQSGQSGSADPWAAFQWDGKVDSLPPDVAKVIREAREEAGKSRTIAKQNAAEEARKELLATISKAVGLGSDDAPPSPEELTRQLQESHHARTTAEEQAAAAAIELHIYKTAQRLGANADALLDSRAFCDQIDSLDPSDPKAFNAAVERTINEALGRNPNLRAQSVGRSGGDLSGGTGEGTAQKRGAGGLAGAITNHYQT